MNRVRLAVALAALAAGILAAVVVSTSDHAAGNAAVTAAFSLAICWSFIGTGLVAWARRPESRFGLLMIATGFAWFAASLGSANEAWLIAVGFAAGALPYATFAHLLLAYPTGRLGSFWPRAAVATAYFTAVPLQLTALTMSEYGEGPFSCPGCPPNALLVSANAGVANAVSTAEYSLGVVLAAAVVVILRQRWVAATRPARRALAPVYWTGGIVALCGVVLFGFELGWDGGVEGARIAIQAALVAVPVAFLVGLLQLRLRHLGVVRLALDLNLGSGPDRLRASLVRAFGDPSLEVGYWFPEGQRFVDEQGGPLELPRAGEQRAATVVERLGQRVAVLVHDASLLDQPELIDGVRAVAGLALENQRLQAELRAQLAELRASRARIVEAGDAERRRLERNLHDGAQQRLVALSLGLRLARSRVRADPDAAEQLLDAAADELGQALEELRELARGIHPAVLTDRGLEAALEALAARSPTGVELEVDLHDPLPNQIAAAVYYVVSESLANVAKHAEATTVSVSVVRVDGAACVEVVDDGVGGVDVTLGSGLRGLFDRVASLDGALDVESRPGAGTRISARIPAPK